MTIGEYIATLKNLEAKLQPFVDIAIDVGGDELEANLKNRVFNANEDISGKGFGGYSESYKAYRLSLGKDVSTKNLQLTDKMRLGIFFDTKEKELRFKDQEDANKGRGNEVYLKQVIFDASESEIKKTISVIEEEFNNLIGEQLN